MLDSELDAKQQKAISILRSLDGAVVAFSGGVDSTLLLCLAREALGEHCLALTAVSPSLPARERMETRSLARSLGVQHRWVTSNELERTGYTENGSDRCYFCKSELFELCFQVRDELGLGAVVYGATADDLGEHRPGMAAGRERGARAPLLEAGMGKQEIRDLSRHLGLPTWDKPAMACLASRFPYGTKISSERLGRVEAAEAVLWEEGFYQGRVRFHENIARIEVEAEAWIRLGDPAVRERVVRGVQAAGFRYVTLDLVGFSSGRLDRESRAQSQDKIDVGSLD